MKERPDSAGNVVLVDDEQMVLTSISTFVELETDYTIKTFTSAKRALEHIAGNEVDLVISDYLMPELDGIQFLAKVKELKPEVPRVILTGYADKENAIKAINEIGLYHYVQKPWDNEDLRIVIRNGVEKKQLLSKLRDKVQEINRAYGELQEIQRDLLKTFA